MKSNLKFDEALSDGELLYYCVRTSKGTSIASVHQNECPFEGDEVITLEDAKKYAELFASAPALLEENTILRAEVDRLTKEKSELLHWLKLCLAEIRTGYELHGILKKEDQDVNSPLNQIKDLLTRIK